jgi:heme-degrading monooxygenase HmoA
VVVVGCRDRCGQPCDLGVSNTLDDASVVGRSDVAERRAKLEVNVISRQWRGLAKASAAPAYIKHLRDETFPALRNLPGFVDASILTRSHARGIEFLIVTQWRSVEDIASFAGSDLEAAVVPAKVAEMMVEYQRHAEHFEVME